MQTQISWWCESMWLHESLFECISTIHWCFPSNLAQIIQASKDVVPVPCQGEGTPAAVLGGQVGAGAPVHGNPFPG